MKVLLILCILIGASAIRVSFEDIEESKTLAINDAAINIIESCFSNGIRTVGVISPTDSFLSKIILSGLVDVMVIQKISNLPKDSQTSEKIPYKLYNFVISAYSVTDLLRSLDIWKLSIWWNTAGRFIIMEKYPARNDCKNADEFLKVLWKYDIFDGIVVCTEPSSRVTVFGFNPYSGEAPSSWSLDHARFYEDFDKRSFTIFKLHITMQLTCNSIFFEAISDLHGYPITSNMKNYPPTTEIDIDRSSKLVILNRKYPMSKNYYYVKITSRDWNHFNGIDSVLAREFFTFYNATAVIKIYDNSMLFGAVDENGKAYGMLRDQKSGDIDIGFNNRFMHRKGDISFTYPLQQSELTAVTHFRGDMNILIRIINFLNFKILISMLIICLLTIFFFAYFVGKGIQLAILDTIQLLLGMSLQKIPSGLSSQIFFCCLITYYSIISASVQTNMYAIVTAPQALRNVDSFGDLQNLEYKLYVNSVGGSMLQPEVYKNLEVIKTDHCIDRILNKFQVACIDDMYYLKNAAAEHGLHVMKEGIVKTYLVYLIRKDWPLYRKLNDFYAKFNEAGIVKMLSLRSEESANVAIKLHDQKYKSKKFQVMTLSSCGSIFYLWIVGIFISIIVFFIELQIFTFSERYSNNFIIIWCKRINDKSKSKLDFFRGCH